MNFHQLTSDFTTQNHGDFYASTGYHLPGNLSSAFEYIVMASNLALGL